MKISQIVSTHQPYKAHTRVAQAQRLDRGSGIARAKTCLQIADYNPGMPDQRARRRHPPLDRRRPLCFQGVTGRDQPPNTIKLEPLERLGRNMKMAGMWWVKRPAQQADHLTSSGKWHVLSHHGGVLLVRVRAVNHSGLNRALDHRAYDKDVRPF